MAVRTAAVLEVAQAAAADRGRLLRLSRPATWLVAGMPFLVGALAAERGISLLTGVGLLYFLAPFALLRGGLRDIHARGNDPDRPDALATRFAVAVINLPFLFVLALAGGPAAAAALLLTVALVVAEAAPPFALRIRPGLDVLVAGALIALPATCGWLLGGGDPGAIPWIAFACLTAWGVGTSALAAIVARLGDDAEAAGSIGDGLTGTVDAVGVTWTAVIALIAYIGATTLALTLGFFGLLAGMGLALFTLLPLMILAAGSPGVTPPRRTGAEAPRIGTDDAGPAPSAPFTGQLAMTLPEPTISASVAAVAAAARLETAAQVGAAVHRAWRDLRGLVVLVGAWLLVLLLQAWSITTYAPWTVAIMVPAVLTGYALANLLAIRIAARRRRVRTSAHASETAMASLTIVVPTRDDIATLPSSLASLRAQTYPDTTILVVDDASTDGTPDEAGAWVGTDAVVTAPPRPEGWTSHAWACRSGAELASTDLILFVDPDTVLAPIAARILVEQLEARRSDLLVGFPRAAMPTVGERAAVPGFALLRYGFVPIWWTALVGGRLLPLAGGDGPLVMVRREAYLAVGGHTAPREGVRPGSVLTDAFARSGKRMGVVRIANLAATRRYHDTPAAVAGWRRRILPDGLGQLAGAIAIVALVTGAFLVPLLLPAVAALSHVDADLLAASCIPLLILVVMRLFLAIFERQSPGALLWHPVTILLALIGQVMGIVDHVAGDAADRLARPARDRRPAQPVDPVGPTTGGS